MFISIYLSIQDKTGLLQSTLESEAASGSLHRAKFASASAPSFVFYLLINKFFSGVLISIESIRTMSVQGMQASG